MANTTLPNLPPVISLSPQALVWVNQNGVDYSATVGAIAQNATFDIRNYGASPTGTAAQNTAAMLLALLAASSAAAANQSAAVLIFGYYQINAFTVPTDVWLIGTAPSSCGFYQTVTSTNFITFGGDNAGCYGIGVICTVAATAGATVYVGANGAKLLNFALFAAGTPSEKMFLGVQFDPITGGEYLLDNFSIVGAQQCIKSGNTTNTSTTSPPFGIVSNGQLSAIPGGSCISLHQNGGTTWTNIQCLFGLHGISTFPETGQYVEAQLFVNCLSDTMTGDCWSIGTGGGLVSDIQLNQCWGCSSTGGNGITIQGLSVGQIDSVTIIGGIYSNNDQTGINFSVCKNVNIQSPTVYCNSTAGSGMFAGIAVGANTNEFMISNAVSGLGGRIAQVTGVCLQSYGIVVNGGTSDYYNITNNRCPGNVTGGSTIAVLDAGTGVHKNLIGNLAG